MAKRFNGSIAVVVFLVLSAVFLWLTDSFQRGDASDGAEQHAGHGHGAAAMAVDPCASATATPTASPTAVVDACQADTAAACDHAEAAATGAAAQDWCAEHGVPESACTRCNTALIAQFKAKGDWCNGHGVPESQCVICNPDQVPISSKLSDLEARRCEHAVPIVQCDNCRYEVGVVKLDPTVAKSLISIGKAEQRQMNQVLGLTGIIQLDQTRVVEVSPVAAGRVVRVEALLGQQVEPGQLLAVLHSSEFAAAKAAYQQAITRAEIAREERDQQLAVSRTVEIFLNKLTINPTKSAKTGSFPTVDSLGLQGQWKSGFVDAVARLELAQTTFEREYELWKKQVSSKATLEQAEQELQSSQAAYAALIEEIRLNYAVDKVRASNAAKNAEAKLRAAQQHLYTFGLDDAAVEALHKPNPPDSFALLEVKAPRAGTIIAQNVSTGNFVQANQWLYRIADLTNLWVWCDAYERDLAALNAAVQTQGSVPATVTVAAFGDATFAGFVDLIDSSIDERTRTVKIRVQIDNAHGRLKPGMFADVQVQAESAGLITVVPTSAVVSDQNQPFVFQQWQDDLWVRRDVVTGQQFGQLMEIRSGVEPGVTVVTSGAFMLKSDVLREKMGAGCAD